MDRRVSDHARHRARRDGRPLPRAEAARRRLGPPVADGRHRAADRQDGAFAVQPDATAVDRAMRSLRVLVLMHPELVPPDSAKGFSETEKHAWKTEYDV